MTIICYEVLNDGEGELGDQVELVGNLCDGMHCAEEAALYFDDCEKYKERLTDSDYDQTSQVIEVQGFRDEPPTRFRVSCAVKRKYRAEKL